MTQSGGTEFDTGLRRPPAMLVRWHRQAHGNRLLRRFTLGNRLLLALAFLPTGLVKLLGQRFTTMPLETPVGFFFEAMYRTGVYWHFLGAMQVLAAVLLLIPATAPLGALLFLPICLSVLLITIGVGFGNTVYIVALMLLASVYLLAWDADRFWIAGAVALRRRGGPGLLAGASPVERAGWWLGATAGLVFWLGTRGWFGGVALAAVGTSLLGGVLVLVGLLFPRLGRRR